MKKTRLQTALSVVTALSVLLQFSPIALAATNIDGGTGGDKKYAEDNTTGALMNLAPLSVLQFISLVSFLLKTNIILF